MLLAPMWSPGHSAFTRGQGQSRVGRERHQLPCPSGSSLNPSRMELWGRQGNLLIEAPWIVCLPHPSWDYPLNKLFALEFLSKRWQEMDLQTQRGFPGLELQGAFITFQKGFLPIYLLLGREKHQFIVPLIHTFISWLLSVPWSGIEPATLTYWDDT